MRKRPGARNLGQVRCKEQEKTEETEAFPSLLSPVEEYAAELSRLQERHRTDVSSLLPPLPPVQGGAYNEKGFQSGTELFCLVRGLTSSRGATYAPAVRKS